LIRPAISALAALTLLGCASEQAPPPSASAMATAAPPAKTEPGYLSAADLHGSTVLGPPPAADSPHGRADRAFYDETRSLEGSPRWKLAIQDNDLWQGGALQRFSCALGKDISQRQTPTAWRLLHRLETDVRTIGTPAKDHFARRRPALGNDKPICVPREPWMETNASYPSGHAMTVWSWALLLTEAEPAKADALLKLGREAGESRVVCGVHFPSDVEAGRTLAAGMVARLHADPAFMADLTAAKREIAAARTPPSNCPA
jgi:acid phosphatase (class A)